MAGPRRIPIPALPNLPTSAGLAQTGVEAGQPGMANAAGLNQLVILCGPTGAVLTPGTTSGRPPRVLVLDVSKPVNEGVKYCPDCSSTFQAICQPPRNACTIPDWLSRKRWPWPTGSLYTAYPKKRRGGVI